VNVDKLSMSGEVEEMALAAKRPTDLCCVEECRREGKSLMMSVAQCSDNRAGM